MRAPTIDIRPDHLLLHLHGPASVLAPHRDVLIPLSDIVEAKAEAPRWPTATGQWQIATYLPGVIAVGEFHEWKGTRRLLAIDRNTREALTLRLAGHPNFDEVTIAAENAAALADTIVGRSPKVPWKIAPRE